VTLAEPVAAEGVEASARDFAEIVREHQSMVFSIAWHFLRDRAAAEELAQDVFLQLHEHLGAMQSPQHMIYWLRKVTSHRCLDHLRRSKQHLHVPLESIAEPASSGPASDIFLARCGIRRIWRPRKSRAPCRSRWPR
jgi:RNA polymerase sigma-70 factor, ECF subfamily